MSVKIEAPGIHHDFDIAAYHADPCPAPSLNQSVAKVLIDRSPAHARCKHPRLSPVPIEDEADAACDIGNAAHKLVLGRGAEIAVGDFKDYRTNAAKDWRDEVIGLNKQPILAKHFASAAAIQSAVEKQCRHGEFTNGKAEVVVAWQEEGFWFRTLIDWLHDDREIVDDLKTMTQSCAPQELPRLIVEHGWDVQAAFQERALNAVMPQRAGRWRWRFVAVEQKPPFGLSTVMLPESAMELGRRKVARAVATWKRCLERDDWPGYEPVVHTTQPPAWAIAQWEEREIEIREMVQ